MGGIGEGLAEAGQGILAAAAVEPATGHDGHTHETVCLNCATPLVGQHCHSCGQAAHVHRTLGAFFHDLLHGVFHFEGKIWRTLPLLLWHPGRLTRQYIDGRRASYISPIALFLFTMFLMFAVFQATGSHGEGAVVLPEGENVEQTISRLEREIGGLEGRKRTAAAKGEDTGDLDIEIRTRKQALGSLRVMDGNTRTIVSGGTQIDSNIPAIEHAIQKFRKNPDLVAYKLQTYAYKYSWALIPISVPFLWLLFPFSRRFHLYDHTVFVTYSLCFMALLVIAGMLASAASLGVWPLLLLLPPVHMYRQLRGAYGVGRGSALVRTAMLVLFSVAALLAFFLMIMAQSSF